MENYDGLFENNNAEPFDKGKWLEQKREEREAVYQMIDDAATAAVSSGEQFQLFLNVQARFDRYSASNVLLIAHQRPDATRLADFAAWKDAGVHIKKGESTITGLEENQFDRGGGSGLYGRWYDKAKRDIRFGSMRIRFVEW